jgi:hypothetical protein
MPFSTLLLSGATVGMTTLAFAIATPASAQEYYAHKHYAHTHYAHARYRHHYESRQIIVHAPAPAPAQAYAWGPAAAVGNVVVGTGQAVQGVFNGAGAVVGGVLGGVVGGTAALFGYPYSPSYAYAAPSSYPYGAPFAAPFNAAGAVAASPFQVVGGAFGGTPAAHPGY